MNRIESVTKPLKWFIALLVVAVAAGCSSGSSTLSSAKAITAYSLGWTTGTPGTAIGTISGGTASPFIIAVTVPSGTSKVGMIATFTTTGENVTVGNPAVKQVSGTTPNDFTSPVVYTVTAADGTKVFYTVTVTVTGTVPVVVTCTTGATNCVDLKTSANYVIFGTSGITNASSNTVETGNLGTAAAASTITGFVKTLSVDGTYSTDPQVTGKIYAFDYVAPTPSAMTTASNDVLAAFTAANAVGGGAGVGAACPGAGNFSGLAIPPGVYACGGVTIPTSFTLAGTGAATDVWVFKLSGALGMTGGAGMTFTGTQGALPQNVFWAVAGAVSIGTGSTLEGVVLGASNIDTLGGSIVHGRLLSQTAVNLQAGTNVVTQP